jgi:hypothetical protein
MKFTYSIPLIVVDIDDFLLTYRTYVAPMDLLQALIERFKTAPLSDEKVQPHPFLISLFLNLFYFFLASCDEPIFTFIPQPGAVPC